MKGNPNAQVPRLFEQLIQLGCLKEEELWGTQDGFCTAVRSMADILAARGITTIPIGRKEELECRLFFDDWYLYALPCRQGHTYSLFKMREQEYDREKGLYADGDTPGVTISFIELRTEILMDCLTDPTYGNRRDIDEEINRVVSYRRQRHNQVLKDYFIRTGAQGPYLVAKLYIRFIASLFRDGELPVPVCYAQQYEKRGSEGRVARFLKENNKAAGRVVCDHKKIYVQDPARPTQYERLAILATHTANTSLFSFAAEVQFHARFLTWWARIPIPFVGSSPYASAIRADMSIGDKEFAGPTPYYRPESKLMQGQYACHKERAEEFLTDLVI